MKKDRYSRHVYVLQDGRGRIGTPGIFMYYTGWDRKGRYSRHIYVSQGGIRRIDTPGMFIITWGGTRRVATPSMFMYHVKYIGQLSYTRQISIKITN